MITSNNIYKLTHFSKRKLLKEYNLDKKYTN